MTPEARKDALERLETVYGGLLEIVADSSIPGGLRIWAERARKHLAHIEIAIRSDAEIDRNSNNHLGAVSD